ncbi:MAG TPA: hypothetical protein VIT89_04370 [Solirubrobacterales bacterium]
MAQTKKKRRRKQRGTQGGRIDNKPRSGRPRSREEAKSRARSKRKPVAKGDMPPTWRGAFFRGAVAALIFVAVLALVLGKSIGAAFLFGAFMMVLYVPAGYFIDMTLWRRRERARIRARSE